MLTISPKVEQEVLLLPSDERLALIDKLIVSLNLPTQTDIDKLWSKEAEKRIKELVPQPLNPPAITCRIGDSE